MGCLGACSPRPGRSSAACISATLTSPPPLRTPVPPLQERKLQLYGFDGIKEREWVLDSVIRYIKV